MIAYAVFAAVVQAFWLTFAPIDTSAADYYGVSVGSIGWLAEICVLFYVILALPAGRLLDRSFRPALAAGICLAAGGGVVRVVDSSFAVVMAGQVLVSFGQPLVTTAVAKVAGDYLPASDRAGGIAIGGSAGFVGMIAALVLAPTLGGDGQITRLLLVEAVLGLVSAAVLLFLLRAPAPFEGSLDATVGRGVRVRSLWELPLMRRISVLAFVGFGIFVALTTWLQSLLDPSGASEAAAAAVLIGMLVAGMAGCALIPTRLTSLGAEQAFLRTAVGAAVVGPALLAVSGSIGTTAAILAVMGFALLPALPVLLTAAERVSGVTAAGTAAAIVWLSGNLGGVVAAVLVQTLVGSPGAAFLAMAAFGCLAIPVAWNYLSEARSPA